MDVFELHQNVIDDYAAYTRSFIRISDKRIAEAVHQEISEGLLWPEPLLQLNPSFAPGKKIDELVTEGVLHEDCGRIFHSRVGTCINIVIVKYHGVYQHVYAT